MPVLLIKPFGSDRIKFISQSYSPLLTALTRFFLATVVFVSLIAFIDEKPPEKVLNDIVNSFENSQSLANKSPAEQEQAIHRSSACLWMSMLCLGSRRTEKQVGGKEH